MEITRPSCGSGYPGRADCTDDRNVTAPIICRPAARTLGFLTQGILDCLLHCHCPTSGPRSLRYVIAERRAHTCSEGGKSGRGAK